RSRPSELRPSRIRLAKSNQSGRLPPYSRECWQPAARRLACRLCGCRAELPSADKENLNPSRSWPVRLKPKAQLPGTTQNVRSPPTCPVAALDFATMSKCHRARDSRLADRELQSRLINLE